MITGTFHDRRRFACLLSAIAAAGACAAALADDADATSTTQPAVVRMSDDHVELHVVDTPLTTVLRMLSTEGRRNIIASGAVQGTVTADLFDVSFREAMDAILTPNGCGFVQRGNFIHVYTFKELAEQQAAADGHRLTVRLFHLNYVSTQDIEPMIRPLLSADGKIATMPEPGKTASSGTGGGSSGGGSSEGGGSTQLGQGNLLSRPDAIIVSDYPDRLAAIEKVIRELDVRPRQVLVEATILRATLGENTTLGIDFNVLGGVNFEELTAVSPGVT
ncbi:MAG: hypothetical protein HY718_14915, partial [Planctomycetes bacterium]|nr:hypothetical protein [Planctomycetota bacterium]